MFNTLEEVKANQYINKLDEAVEKFGLTGVYVEYKVGPRSQDSSIYFVCGKDRARILSGKFNIQKLYDEARLHNNLIFNTAINAYNLTNCAPFATHQCIFEFCKHAEFIQTLYTEYNKPVPMTMTYRGIVDAKMLYSNIHNSQTDQQARSMYEEALMRVFDYEESFRDPKHPNYAQNMYQASGLYDNTAGRLSNWIKKNFSADKNRVSLEHLFSESPAVCKVNVSIRIYKQLIMALRKRPDILYWTSKVQGKKYKFPVGQGFGPTADSNDTRTVNFAFNQDYLPDVLAMTNQISYPEARAISPEEMIQKEGQVCVLEIPAGDYPNFRNLCYANGVPFCIDDQYHAQRGEELVMLVPYKYQDMMDSILMRLSNETEEFHLKLPGAEKTICTPSLNPELLQADFEKLGITTSVCDDSLDNKLKSIASNNTDHFNQGSMPFEIFAEPYGDR